MDFHINYITFWFSSVAAGIILIGVIVNFFEKNVPFFGKAFRYGKIGLKDKDNYRFMVQLPKSYFKHFYWIAIFSFTYAFYQATNVYIFGYDVPQYLFEFLDVVSEKERKAQVSATHLYIALGLMTVQSYRRFYDTHFVSVFGKNSKMNILHYLMGVTHYPGAAIALLCEAPKFANNTKFASNDIDLSKLSYVDYFAIAMFLWAWWHQHKTSKILGNLRKNKKGEVVTSEHKLPFGDWFEYFSCPHQIAELLMYTSITIILVYHITWFFVYIWVLTNQVETILLSHWWYIGTFKNFPKNRKALVPFIY